MALTHDFQVQLVGQRAVVDADGVRIEQILENLLSNAVKYSPSGGEVRVSVASDGRG